MSDKKSLRFIGLAIGFGIFLLLPFADQFLGLSSGVRQSENRRLEGFPRFHWPHVGTFAKQFDRYYKENFGFRNALFYTYSRWKLRVLNESPLPEKVIVGHDNWLYLGNSYNRVIDQHRGLIPLSADSAQIIGQNLVGYQNQLASQGRKLYVFIAPDSHTIYPEYLPSEMQVSDRPSRLDVLSQYVTRNTNLPFIDVRDTLRKAKAKHVVYYQTDTHWNDYGTLVGCASLLNRIHHDFGNVPAAQLANYQIARTKGVGGDLVQMLMLENVIKDKVFYDIKPLISVAARQLAEVPDTVTGRARSGFPSLRFAGANAKGPKLLLIGDSFSHSMTQFLPGYFRESYFVRTSRFDPALVQAEQPDIVVIEIVERNLDWLARF
ncbi:hypothetical protein GCM10028806_46320 [Spirosoma terrae]|uniref:AlgX/AlgJ SGNH hydrolase-like domain-containing protein n=1 Tax=Spirosoma terrae TaxID=1968276 RepID=A0A6L9L2J7_9BACT|nr:hypothetical protein [Spirosoma terrae]NDU93702.1 hypothetical protein [Spirosoma terrae]